MSYLHRPRLHFAGRFEADVSTVNNDPTNFNDVTFGPKSDPSWNPTGTGTWRLFDCSVTAVECRDGTAVREDDPVFALALADSGERVPAKLVDLDPEQQMASQIWGLRLRLMAKDGAGVAFSARYAVAPFTDMWSRADGAGGDRNFGAVYQSVLLEPDWCDDLGSPFLADLRAAANGGPLSIRFMVDGFTGSGVDPTGRIAGCIGAHHAGEPYHFSRGRHLFSSVQIPFRGVTFYHASALVDRDAHKLIVDAGNALPTHRSAAYETPALADIGTVAIGTRASGTFAALGEVPYREPRWYERTSGIVEFALTPAELDALAGTPLELATVDAHGTATTQVSEAPDGIYVRADSSVFRMSPGEMVETKVYASRFGMPYANAPIAVDFDKGLLQLQGGDGALAVCTPKDALVFDKAPTADADGVATLHITGTDPRNPRGFIDGQVYGVRASVQGALGPANPWDFVSVLLWNAVTVPERPTWWDDVQPILRQYANLYPIMRQVLDLGDYVSVIAHKDMLRMVFEVPVDDPNAMPVTRDLSPAKRRLILRWLETAAEPALGNAPPEWTIARARAAAAPQAASSPGGRPGGSDFDEQGGKGEAALRVAAAHEETER